MFPSADNIRLFVLKLRANGGHCNARKKLARCTTVVALGALLFVAFFRTITECPDGMLGGIAEPGPRLPG